MVPSPGVPFPPQGPEGFRSPASSVLRDTLTSCRPSPKARFPSAFKVLRKHGETTGPPRFLERPLRRTCPALRPRRDGNIWPFSMPPHGLQLFDFLGSRDLSHLSGLNHKAYALSLSTLRSPDHSGTTQDSLPADGQSFPDPLPCGLGLITEGFELPLLLPQAYPGAPSRVTEPSASGGRRRRAGCGHAPPRTSRPVRLGSGIPPSPQAVRVRFPASAPTSGSVPEFSLKIPVPGLEPGSCAAGGIESSAHPNLCLKKVRVSA